MSDRCTRCGRLVPMTLEERREAYRSQCEQSPCTGELGCAGLDVDALPALRLMSGEPYTSEPCDNCKDVDFIMSALADADRRVGCRCV